MNGSAQREQEVAITPSRRASYRPSLSVIVISAGDRRELESALAAVCARCRRMEAEVIVVRASGIEGVAPLTETYPHVTFVDAPANCSERDLRDIGMGVARGDIVALRTDTAAGDGSWLSAFHATVGTIDDERHVEVEVALAVSVEESAAGTDRRRGRSSQHAGFAAAPSVALATSKRRQDAGRVGVSYTDAAPMAPTLGTEM